MSEPKYVVGYYKKALKIKKGDVRRPGEAVPEASTWAPNVLQSHLNVKFIQHKEEFELIKEQEERKAKIKKETAEKSSKLKRKAQRIKFEQEQQDKQQTEDKAGDEEAVIVETKQADVEDKPSLDDKTKNELKGVALEMGLSVKGNKKELIARIEGSQA